MGPRRQSTTATLCVVSCANTRVLGRGGGEGGEEGRERHLGHHVPRVLRQGRITDLGSVGCGYGGGIKIAMGNGNNGNTVPVLERMLAAPQSMCSGDACFILRRDIFLFSKRQNIEFDYNKYGIVLNGHQKFPQKTVFDIKS